MFQKSNNMIYHDTILRPGTLNFMVISFNHELYNLIKSAFQHEIWLNQPKQT